MVPNMSRPRHLGGDINHRCRNRVLRQYSAKPLGVVHAVLKAQHQRVGLQMGPDLGAGRFRVGRFDAKQHQTGAAHGAGIGAC